MAQNAKALRGQSHAPRSFIESALCLLLLNKHKKFENDAIARFCSSANELRKGGKKNMATSTITKLTESTSWSIIILISTESKIDREVSWSIIDNINACMIFLNRKITSSAVNFEAFHLLHYFAGISDHTKKYSVHLFSKHIKLHAFF